MMSQPEVYHIPALLEPTIQALNIRPGGTYVDVTYGGGGHSRAIMERIDADAGGRLYAFDQDRDALDRAPDDRRLTTVLSNFRYVTNFMRYHGVEHVDGILADLGVSFHHFDDASRGFTFRDHEAPLDMRMNRGASLTAADVLQTYSAERLGEILRLYGELPQAARLARAIVSARERSPLLTAGDLTDAVGGCLNPARLKKDMARLFQALRIEVNDEIGALRGLLADSVSLLADGGRLAIITYHSLEDRLVKNFMRTGNIEGRQDKDFFGVVHSPLTIITKSPVTPDDREIERNPRSRSAKLRVAQRNPRTDD